MQASKKSKRTGTKGKRGRTYRSKQYNSRSAMRVLSAKKTSKLQQKRDLKYHKEQMKQLKSIQSSIDSYRSKVLALPPGSGRNLKKVLEDERNYRAFVQKCIKRFKFTKQCSLALILLKYYIIYELIAKEANKTIGNFHTTQPEIVRV